MKITGTRTNGDQCEAFYVSGAKPDRKGIREGFMCFPSGIVRKNENGQFFPTEDKAALYLMKNRSWGIRLRSIVDDVQTVLTKTIKIDGKDR